MKKSANPETSITIKCDGQFNAGWLWAVLGMDMPHSSSEAFKEGFDTAKETPSLGTTMFVMREEIARGRIRVSDSSGPTKEGSHSDATEPANSATVGSATGTPNPNL